MEEVINIGEGMDWKKITKTYRFYEWQFYWYKNKW